MLKLAAVALLCVVVAATYSHEVNSKASNPSLLYNLNFKRENFCSDHNNCGNCTEDPTCGWCGSTEQCYAGNSSAPSEKNCPSGWSFDNCTEIPPLFNCSDATTCAACTSELNCGWCEDTNECTEGTEDGPDNGECQAENWNFNETCIAFTCETNLNCSSCLSDPLCGWCESDQTCFAGDDQGPIEGTCNDWYYEEICPAVGCSKFDGACEQCVLEPDCGYCQSSDKCLSGDENSPDEDTCDGTWDFAECSTILPCSSRTYCDACARDEFCGWCASSGTCGEGFEAPIDEDFCPIADWIGSFTGCPPEPDVVEVRFSDGHGHTIEVLFTTNTDRAGLSGVWDCTELFSVDSVDLFGDSPTCFWRDDRTIIIRLGRNAVVDIGDPVTTLVTKISNKNGTETGTSDSLDFVKGPRLAVPPVAVLAAPGYITKLQDVILDGSQSYGSGNKPWSAWVWELIFTDSDGTAIADLFNGDSSEVITIPASLLNSGSTYKVSLTITNWLNQTSSAEATFYVMRSESILVSINGGSKMFVHRTNPLTLRAEISPPADCVDKPNRDVCDEDAVAAFSWTWSKGPEPIELDPSTRIARSLHLKPETLIGGEEYEITVSGTLDDNMEEMGYASVDICVFEDPLFGRVQGAYHRVQSRLAPVPLNLVAFDPNGVPGASLAYEWNCEVLSHKFDEFDAICHAQRFFDTSEYQNASVEVPAAVLNPGLYHFTGDAMLKDSAGDELDRVSDIITVQILWEDAPTVQVFVEDETGLRPERVSPSTRLLFRSEVSSPTGAGGFEYLWEQIEGDIDLHNSSNSGVNNPTLELAPGTLTPGGIYRFMLTVTDENFGDSSLAGSAEVIVYAGTAPWGGSCTISPDTGFAYETVFTASCKGWQDEIDDYPLFYQFFLENPGQPEFILSTGFFTQGEIPVVLPPSDGDTTTVYYSVTDRWGVADAGKYVLGEVQVLSPISGAKRDHFDTARESLQFIDEAAKGADALKIAQIVYGIVTAMNNEGAADYSEYPFSAEEEEVRLELAQRVRNLVPLAPSLLSVQQRLQLILALSGGLDRAPERCRTQSKRNPLDVFVPEPTPQFIELELSEMLLDTLALGFGLPSSSVQLVVDILSNLVFLSQPFLQENSEVGLQVGANLVEAVDMLIKQLQDRALPFSENNWESEYAVVHLRKDLTPNLPLVYTYEDVEVEFPEYLSCIETEQVCTGIALLFADPYSSYDALNSNSSSDVVISSVVIHIAMRDGDGNDLEFDSLPEPMRLTFPTKPQVSDALLAFIDSKYGRECQRWDLDSSMWVAGDCNYTAEARYTICECNELLVATHSSARHPLTIPEGPGPVGLIEAGDVLENESTGNAILWWLIPLVIFFFCLLCLAFLLFAAYRRRSDGEYTEIVEIDESMQVRISDKDRNIKERPISPRPRPIRAPDLADNDPSEILLKPKVDNEVITFYRSDASDFSESSSYSSQKSGSSSRDVGSDNSAARSIDVSGSRSGSRSGSVSRSGSRSPSYGGSIGHSDPSAVDSDSASTDEITDSGSMDLRTDSPSEHSETEKAEKSIQNSDNSEHSVEDSEEHTSDSVHSSDSQSLSGSGVSASASERSGQESQSHSSARSASGGAVSGSEGSGTDGSGDNDSQSSARSAGSGSERSASGSDGSLSESQSATGTGSGTASGTGSGSGTASGTGSGSGTASGTGSGSGTASGTESDRSLSDSGSLSSDVSGDDGAGRDEGVVTNQT